MRLFISHRFITYGGTSNIWLIVSIHYGVRWILVKLIVQQFIIKCGKLIDHRKLTVEMTRVFSSLVQFFYKLDSAVRGTSRLKLAVHDVAIQRTTKLDQLGD